MASSDPEDFYDRAMGRITRFGLVLGAAGTLYVWARYGPRFGGGFLAGAAVSLFSFRNLRRMAEAFGSSRRVGVGLSSVLFGLRYLLIGGAVYVIVKSLEISVMPVLAGLFVSVAAVLIEIVFEIFFSKYA